jgi:hypothetical protein
MDQRIRFVGVLDKNATIIEGGMRKNVSSLLDADKNDLFYLRVLSHLKELKDFKNGSRRCQVYLYPNGQNIFCNIGVIY